MDGENYCLHIGFTKLTPGSAEWSRTVEAMLGEERSDSGVATLDRVLTDFARQPRQQRVDAEAKQIEQAFKTVGSKKLLDLALKERQPSASLLRRYPEVRSQAAKLRAVQSRVRRPGSGEYRATATYGFPGGGYDDQDRTYWCGPATMRMIDWVDGAANTQSLWASRMGTTTDGTSLTNMVYMANYHTKWINTWNVVDVRGDSVEIFGYRHYIMIAIFQKPIIEHVRLETAFFDYLRCDHGGHFQMGRGYNTTGNDATSQIMNFEPYDERDWVAGGNYTGKANWVTTRRYYEATTARGYFGTIGW